MIKSGYSNGSMNENSSYTEEDTNQLIKDAIRGDQKSIKRLGYLGYKVTKNSNPLKSVEVDTYVISKGNRKIAHQNVFGSKVAGDRIIDNPAEYLG
jgi:hypothetical protein